MRETKTLLVRDRNTREVVATVPVAARTAAEAMRMVQGVLVDLDTERFYVDDAAFFGLYRLEGLSMPATPTPEERPDGQ